METRKRNNLISSVTTGALGLALISLAACNSGESTPTTGTPTSGGSAALQGAMVFVHNATSQTTSVVALRGDSGNSVIHTLGKDIAETGHPNGAYDGNAPGDMQFSEGEWVFVNVGEGNGVALIDPVSGAKPIFEGLLQVGRRPVHIYRDPTDKQVIWTMMDADATTGVDNVSATIPDTNTVVDCSTTGGGSVTIIHNSHIPTGGKVPEIIGKVCLYAKGHKVAAFSSGSVPKLAFVSSETSGEIAIIDNDPASQNYLKLIKRIDLCDTAKEATTSSPAVCNNETATPLTTAFTPNNSKPHGIRFSVASQKVYSFQEGYNEIVEIDPNSQAVTPRKLSLGGTPYTSYGITPDGKYLVLRGVDTTTNADSLLGKIAVVDLVSNPTAPLAITAFADLQNIAPSTFKFAPDGKRLYMLASNTATGTGNQLGNQLKNVLMEFDTTNLPAQPNLLRNISLEVTTGNHSFDIYADGPAGAGSAKYVVVSNGTGSNSVSIINATNAAVPKENVPVGAGAGTIMVYYKDAALNNNQASN